MATKPQMESEIERLKGELAGMTAKLQAALENIKRLKTPKPDVTKVPSTCINCGQGTQAIQATAKGYRCPTCGHAWTNAHESAPFRRKE